MAKKSLRHEIAWVLLLKAIVLVLIWFAWFSSPQDKTLDENHVAAKILSSNALKGVHP
ncbi:MAG: cytochrome oxidase putative small subunit CydP [Sulfuricella sp.]